ncbi:sensor histidine kinase [Robinsoniella peoriensis]
MKFNDLSIKKKFFLILLVFIILPFCCISFWLYNMITSSWLQKEYESQYNQLSVVSKAAEIQLKEYERIIGTIYNDEDILKNLNKDQKIPIDYVEITEFLRNLLKSADHIDGAYFFAANGETYFQDSYSGASYIDIYRSHPEWMEKIDELDGRLGWISTFQVKPKGSSKEEMSYISCAMLVKDISHNWANRGEFILNINIDLFDELFEKLEVKDQSTLLIADNMGNIIWSNDASLADSLDAKILSDILKSDESYTEQNYRDDHYIVVKQASGYNDWNYISMIKKDEVLKTREWVVSVVAAQILLVLLFCVFGAAAIQVYIIKPIQKMVVVMNTPDPDFMKNKLYIDQKDEVGSLYRSFNDMNGRILNLIEKNNEANKKEKEYHIQALNAQINPHFMYNTLDTINWMAKDLKAKDISKMITSLSRILRYSISKKEDIVTLEEEINCIKNYLNIYEERYEKAFTSEFRIDAEILEYKTFKMLLQPLVENCLTHGFSRQMKGGHILITGEKEGEDAVLRIRDNGEGMTRERIFYVLSQDSDRIGLSNINQRLKLLYGEKYGLVIESTPGEGTMIIIHFPPGACLKTTGKD